MLSNGDAKASSQPTPRRLQIMENTQTHRATDVARYSGSCHCGAVRFEAELDLVTGATKCNCSICTKVGGTCAICKPGAFTLLEGEGHFGEYAWGGKTA